MYIHTYLVEDHIQTTDQKDPPLLSAGLQPENGVTKRKSFTVYTHVHAHLPIKFVFVCLFACTTLKGKRGVEVCLTCPLDLTIPPQKSTGAKCPIV